MKKMTKAAAVVASTFLVGVALNAGAAHASNEPNAEQGVYSPVLPPINVRTYNCVEAYRSIACFEEYGDKIWVKKKAVLDSFTPQAHWRRLNQDGTLAAHGTCEGDPHFNGAVWFVCDKDLAEDRLVGVQADAYRYSTGTDGDSSTWIFRKNDQVYN